MKRLIIILLLIASPVQAEKIERLGFYNLQEIIVLLISVFSLVQIIKD